MGKELIKAPTYEKIVHMYEELLTECDELFNENRNLNLKYDYLEKKYDEQNLKYIEALDLLNIVLPPYIGKHKTHNEKVEYLNKVFVCKEFLDKFVSENNFAKSMDTIEIQDVENFMNSLLEFARQKGFVYMDKLNGTHCYCNIPIFTTPVKDEVKDETVKTESSKLLQNIINIIIPIVISILSCVIFKFVLKV